MARLGARRKTTARQSERHDPQYHAGIMAPGEQQVQDRGHLNAEPLYICQVAQQGRLEYHIAAGALLARDAIAGNDPRVSGRLISPPMSLDMSRAAALAEMQHYNGLITDTHSQDIKAVGLQGTLALQKKLITAIAQGAPHDGMEAAAVGITFEALGLGLHAAGRSVNLTRRIISIGLRASDRSVLAERHREFDGLVGPLAQHAGMDFSAVADSLARSGLIRRHDPRRRVEPSLLKMFNDQDTGTFMRSMKTVLFREALNLGPSKHPVFDRSRITREIAELPRQVDSQDKSELGVIRRHEILMKRLSLVGEVAAMNISHSPVGKKASVDMFLAAAVSAHQRGQMFEERARMLAQTAERQATPDRMGREPLH